MSNNEVFKREKIKVRWWHIVLIAFFVVLFLFLAYWQWTRFRSGSGTFQNLGYAFQWPLFAAFVVYAYRTALNYENDRIDAENEAAELGQDPRLYQAHKREEKLAQQEAKKGSVKHAGKRITKIDEGFLPQRPQMDVETFNSLNQQRRRRGDEEDNY